MVNHSKNKLLDNLESFSKLPIIIVLQKTFVSFSGLLLVSSLLILIQKFPVKNWSDIIGPNTIELLGRISNIGFNYISLFVVVAFTYYYIDSINSKDNELIINHIPITLLNIAIFISINYPFTDSNKITLLNLKYFGASGVFGGLLVCYVSIQIYVFLLKNKICIKLPKEVPEVIVDSFLSVIPTLVIVLFWWLISYVLNINI